MSMSLTLTLRLASNLGYDLLMWQSKVAPLFHEKKKEQIQSKGMVQSYLFRNLIDLFKITCISLEIIAQLLLPK